MTANVPAATRTRPPSSPMTATKTNKEEEITDGRNKTTKQRNKAGGPHFGGDAECAPTGRLPLGMHTGRYIDHEPTLSSTLIGVRTTAGVTSFTSTGDDGGRGV